MASSAPCGVGHSPLGQYLVACVLVTNIMLLCIPCYISPARFILNAQAVYLKLENEEVGVYSKGSLTQLPLVRKDILHAKHPCCILDHPNLENLGRMYSKGHLMQLPDARKDTLNAKHPCWILGQPYLENLQGDSRENISLLDCFCSLKDDFLMAILNVMDKPKLHFLSFK